VASGTFQELCLPTDNQGIVKRNQEAGDQVTDKIRIELGKVQATLLMPLWWRAKEYINRSTWYI
jgi:hypothetical protein